MRTRRLGWLAWSLWGLTMALEVAAIWLWLGNRSLGGGYFAPQVFLVPGLRDRRSPSRCLPVPSLGYLRAGCGR